MKDEIIVEEAVCLLCGVIYDPLIYEMGEKCAVPIEKVLGYNYCNGNLSLKRYKYKLVV